MPGLSSNNHGQAGSAAVISSPRSSASWDGATESLDLSISSYHQIELSTTPVTSLTFLNPTEGGRYTLVLITGSAAAITWPSSVEWTGGSPPTLTTNGKDIVTLLCSPIRATLTSGNAETYNLNNINGGGDVTMSINGQTVTMGSGDAGNFAAVTAAEVAAVINAQVVGVTADGSSGSVVLTMDAPSVSGGITVVAGANDLNDAADGLDLSTTTAPSLRFDAASTPAFA